MIQGRSELLSLIRAGLVNPAIEENVRNVGIDLRLGSRLKVYKGPLDLRKDPTFETREISSDGYVLEPGAFVLAATLEKVCIPEGFWGFIQTKGNVARAGISAHNSDGHIDPGYEGVVTLELKNQSNVDVIIYQGIKIVELFVMRIEGSSPAYEGKYQGSQGPTTFTPDN